MYFSVPVFLIPVLQSLSRRRLPVSPFCGPLLFSLSKTAYARQPAITADCRVADFRFTLYLYVPAEPFYHCSPDDSVFLSAQTFYGQSDMFRVNVPLFFISGSFSDRDLLRKNL